MHDHTCSDHTTNDDGDRLGRNHSTNSSSPTATPVKSNKVTTSHSPIMYENELISIMTELRDTVIDRPRTAIEQRLLNWFNHASGSLSVTNPHTNHHSHCDIPGKQSLVIHQPVSIFTTSVSTTSQLQSEHAMDQRTAAAGAVDRSTNFSIRRVQPHDRHLSAIERLPADILSRVIGPFLLDDEMLRLAWSSPTITMAVHPGWSSSPYQYQNEGDETIWCGQIVERGPYAEDHDDNTRFYPTRIQALRFVQKMINNFQSDRTFEWGRMSDAEWNREMIEEECEQKAFMNGATEEYTYRRCLGEDELYGRVFALQIEVNATSDWHM